MSRRHRKRSPRRTPAPRSLPRENVREARSRAHNAPLTPFSAHEFALATVIEARFDLADPFRGLRDPLAYYTLRAWARLRGAA